MHPLYRSSKVVSIACILALSICVQRSFAQKPPGLGYAYPPVVVAGETTEVQLGGFDFTPDMQWFVHDARVKFETLGPPGDYHLPPPPYWIGPRAITAALPIPREVRARIVVPNDAPTGPIRWQVANANGSSSTAMVLVSREREVLEHRSRELPQRLDTLPMAVSGRLSRLTEVDRYELLAERDGLVTVDLMARRLGADFLGVLEVRDAAGKLLTDCSDTLGLDAKVTFAVRAGEAYTVSLRDADFRGDRAYVYRLAFRYGPRVYCTIPAHGQRGTTREVEFVGIGIASGKPQLETLRQAVSFPADGTLVLHMHRLETAAGVVEVTIPLSDVPEQVRQSTNDAMISAPIAITATFDRGETEHRYRINAAKDEIWSIEAASQAIGGKLDVSVAVLDSTGKPLIENDDSGSSTDAALDFRVPADGEYFCVVRAMSARTNTADEIYRLQIKKPAADFTLSTNQQINVATGGKTELTVQAKRTGGFDAPITLAVDGLPAGVTIEGNLAIPTGKNEAKLTLVASADAAVVASSLTVRGTAMITDKQLVRVATAIAAGNLAPRTAAEQRTDRVLLAMTMTPPFELQLVDRERQRDVPRGTTYRAEFDVVRKNGFAGPMQIEMAAYQDRNRQGVRGPIVAVPADANKAIYPCFMPEWLSTDLTRRMVVNGVAAVPDPKGTPRYLVQPAVGRVTMIMEGALLKLTADAGEQTILPGTTFEIPFVVARSPKLPLAAKVELVIPDELAGVLVAEPMELLAEQQGGTLRIGTRSDVRLTGDWPLLLRATALEDGQWPVISQTEIVVRFADRQ
jgi:hypothetical protein